MPQDDETARHADALADPREPEGDQQDRLEHIEKVSQNARTTWFGLLALLAFVGVTLTAHEDADFFRHGAETELPLIGITVPTISFFIAAPLLLAAVYAYFHLYLLALWDALAEVEQRPGARPLVDRVYPWLLAQSALWLRAVLRRDGAAGPRTMGVATMLVSIGVSWVLGLVALFALWKASWALHDEWLSLWILACFLAALWIGGAALCVMVRLMAGAQPGAAHRTWPWAAPAAVVFGLVLAEESLRATEGGIYESLWLGGADAQSAYDRWLERFESRWRAEAGIEAGTPLEPRQQPAFWEAAREAWAARPADARALTRADLREEELVAKPDDWQPYDRWIEGFESTYRRTNEIDPDAKLTPAQHRAFWAEARDEWSDRLESLTGPELRERDLRNTDMFRAVLPRADLRGARLDGADLTEAELQGGALNCWDPNRQDKGDELCASLEGTILIEASLQGAVLDNAKGEEIELGGAQLQGASLRSAEMPYVEMSGAQLQGADLSWANLAGANLVAANLDGAVLSSVQLPDADLDSAYLRGADLSCSPQILQEGEEESCTNLAGANLSSSSMQGSDLDGAQMQGADLGGAQMQGTVLFRAQMQGADLGGVQMQGAVLFGAQMQAASLIGAQMQGANLIWARMQGANLSGAQMRGADCSSAFMQGALLQSADVICRNLSQPQLEAAVGNLRTVLPRGLTVASCLESLPGDVEAALAHHPGKGGLFRLSRAQVRDALLCAEDEMPHATGSWLPDEWRIQRSL